MLGSGVADRTRVSVGRVSTEVYDSAPSGAAFQVAPDVLGHHQGVRTRIDGEVLVSDGRREEVNSEALRLDRGWIKRVFCAMCVVINKDVDGAKSCLASVEHRTDVRRIAKIGFRGGGLPTALQNLLEEAIR